MAIEITQLDMIQDRVQQIEDTLQSSKKNLARRKDDRKRYAIVGTFVLLIAVVIFTITRLSKKSLSAS